MALTWSLMAPLLVGPALASGEAAGNLGAEISLLWTLPFAGMLLSIAILPMVAGHWWEEHRHQLLVSALWAAPVLAYFGWMIATGHHAEAAEHGLTHAIEEYVSFIALLGSLFVISGGILLRGDLEGKPVINTAFLAVGAVIANIVGTTGASMLLIRPLLRTNSEREYVKHIPLFFIFLVSNIGGALTPIGDPPLFLGYLRGVPFFWTLEHLWHIWLFPVVVLLVLFFVVDHWFYGKEDIRHRQADKEHLEPLAIDGAWNFLLLGGVVASVLLLSPDPEVHDFRHYYAREIAMVALAALSVWRTRPEIREGNSFTYGPILEVAALFCGIFLTMIPATMILQARGAELGLTEPWQYFWATGALSSFLDNAPTYVTFAAMACGAIPECVSAEQLGTLSHSEVGHSLLVAISVGAVFMGANSYIGNGPNFMVRAIAEENGYKMPSFFGYIGWAALILIPVFVATTFIYLV
ncbi:MAG: sodium:proton antiporter [Deltaproteobacteria bacterium]|nr:MAG: sodium:proton antiporter [Deltaproteobacteria bacterium]